MSKWKKKKQAESDKEWLESRIELKRIEIYENEIPKAHKVLDDIYYKIDSPKAVKAYIEWKRAINESDKASKVLENTAEYKIYKKAEVAYKIAGDKWGNGANIFKKLFYFLIYPQWTYLLIQFDKKRNELESRWKELVSELRRLQSKLFMHPAAPHPVTGISSVDMALNRSRSKIKEAIDNLTFCKKVESL